MKFLLVLFYSMSSVSAWAIECKTWDLSSSRTEASSKRTRTANSPLDPLAIRNPLYKEIEAFDVQDPRFDSSDAKSFRLQIEPLKTDGLGRGFLSALPIPRADRPEIVQRAKALGLMEWGQKMIFVENEAEALQHWKQQGGNPLMAPLYVLTGMKAEEVQALIKGSSAQSKHEATDKESAEKESTVAKNPRDWNAGQIQLWNKIFGVGGESGLHFPTREGRLQRLPKSELSRFRADQAEFLEILVNGNREILIYNRGWFLTPVRGMVSFEEYFYDRHHKPETLDAAKLFSGIGLEVGTLQVLIKQNLTDSPAQIQSLAQSIVDVFLVLKGKDQLPKALKDYKNLSEKEKKEKSLLNFLREGFKSELLQSKRDETLQNLVEESIRKEAHNLRISTARSRRKEVLDFVQQLRKAGGYRDQDGNLVTDLSIRFNQDIEGVIHLAREQDRKGQEKASGRDRLTEDFIKQTLQAFKSGRAYSVELVDQNGRLIGGGFGLIGNGSFEGNSISYPVFHLEREGKPARRFGIEAARLIKLALFEVLAAQGYKYQDSGMVTPFTASVGGRYVPAEYFQKLLAESAKQGDIQTRWPRSMRLEDLTDLEEKSRK